MSDDTTTTPVIDEPTLDPAVAVIDEPELAVTVDPQNPTGDPDIARHLEILNAERAELEAAGVVGRKVDPTPEEHYTLATGPTSPALGDDRTPVAQSALPKENQNG